MTTIEIILTAWIIFLHVLVIYSVKALYVKTKERDFFLKLSTKLSQDMVDAQTVVDKDGFLGQRATMRIKEIEEFHNA